MYRDNLSDEEIHQAVDLFSFIAQARVEFLDADGQLIADSGPFGGQDMLNVEFFRPPPIEGEGEKILEPFLSLSAPVESVPFMESGGAPDTVGPTYRYSVPAKLRGTFGQVIAGQIAPGERSDHAR
jgi:hypothetical protein